MLTVTPARRATLADVLDHWWLNLGHDLTPDGRQYRYQTAALPAARGRHPGAHPSCSSDSDQEPDARCPPPGLHRVPGARCGRKSAETSFDEDEMLYDIGTSSSTALLPPSSPSPLAPALSLGSPGPASAVGRAVSGLGEQCRVNDANDRQQQRHWRQAIADGIEEIRSRVIQSLGHQEGEEEGEEEEGKAGVFSGSGSGSGRADSNANSDACDTDDSSAFHGEERPPPGLDSDRPANVFDSDRKPKRSILKRKGKFSGGDSGCCCIMADDAGPKLDDDECPPAAVGVVGGGRSLPSESSPSSPPPSSTSSTTYAFPPSSAQLCFSKDLASESAASANKNSQSPVTTSSSQVERGVSPPVPLSSSSSSSSAPHPQGTPCPLHHSQTPITPAYTAPAPPSLHLAHSPNDQRVAKGPSPSPSPVCPPGDPAPAPGSSPPAGPPAECTCPLDMDPSKVVRRRRGILKNAGGGGGGGGNRNSLLDDARKRLSVGSLSSNSSADILDLSYDSGDGDQFAKTAGVSPSPSSSPPPSSPSPSSPSSPSSSSSTVGAGCSDPVSSERGDRNSFSLEGEFTALHLEGMAGSLYAGPHQPPPAPFHGDKLFHYGEAQHVLQQAVSLLNTGEARTLTP